MEYILKISKVKKSYKQTKVLTDINMNIKKGDIYGFLGENGAGKSSLFKILLNLITKDEGEIERFGNTDGENMNYFFKQTGSIIENPYFYENLSGRKNLRLHAEYMGYYSKNDNNDRIEEVLTQVGLNEIDDRMVRKYSLGMKQRLALARAMLTKPQFLILDEPFNGLDPKGVVEIRNLLLDLNKINDTTILISSHILSEISLIATTIGVIKNGMIIKEVSMDVVRKEEQQKILLEVDDASKAAFVLEDKLSVEKFRIISNSMIEVYDISLDRSFLNRTLVMNGINVNKMTIQSGTLEDYFLNLV